MVEGKYEHKEEGSRTYQEWSRQWILPETADLNQLRSVLDNDGVLTIEAPHVSPDKDGQCHEIPIHKAGQYYYQLSSARPLLTTDISNVIDCDRREESLITIGS